MGSRSSAPETGRPGSRPDTAAVVLAAGPGTRFIGSTHKLLAPVRGRPLVWHAVSAATDAGIGPVIVVTGAVDVAEALDGLVHLHWAHNADYASGLASSLQVGLTAADHLGARAVVVAPGDQLGVPASAWQAVAGCTDRPIAAATFAGERRPPTRLDRSIWSELPRTGDEGARSLFRPRPDLVAEVPCDGTPHDIDTVEEYRRWI